MDITENNNTEEQPKDEDFLLIERFKNDDTYKFYVRVALIYFFEQCLIGEKTGEEKNAAAAS